MSGKILVTGSAGFIGFHLTEALLKEGYTVVGIDNINDYYDVNLKYSRLNESGICATSAGIWHQIVQSSKYENYRFARTSLEDKEFLFELCRAERFQIIINLAAQAGVRYSIENPDAYIQSNLVGFLNILEAARHFKTEHLIYASSSSVYGLNTTIPFSEHHIADRPASLYAATKKANELMAHTYSYLYGIPTTGLRFFTVYGPWGRPDMAYYLFADAIRNNKPIKVFNHGIMQRDFTYIDDVVKGIVAITNSPFNNNSSKETELSGPMYRILNIGNDSPVSLMDFIKTLELNLKKTALLEMHDMQPGDVSKTWADVNKLEALFNYRPQVKIDLGIKKFVDWYLNYKN